MSVSAQTVFCDLIRREDSGKLLFVGVYTETLTTSQLPANLTLSAWVSVEGLSTDASKVDVRITFPAAENNEVVANLDIQPGPSKAQLFLNDFPVRLERSGDLVISLKFSDGTVVEAGRLAVEGPEDDDDAAGSVGEFADR
ncbi:hypothetical protein KUV28_11625 [Ferrimonas balearica]|nr:hypothetical protein [Ferrimonas balearica]